MSESMDKQPNGQFKFTEDGRIIVVAPSASDKPVKEKQGNLLDWGKAQERLQDWKQG